VKVNVSVLISATYSSLQELHIISSKTHPRSIISRKKSGQPFQTPHRSMVTQLRTFIISLLSLKKDYEYTRLFQQDSSVSAQVQKSTDIMSLLVPSSLPPTGLLPTPKNTSIMHASFTLSADYRKSILCMTWLIEMM
jgi:hypothetical protein